MKLCVIPARGGSKRIPRKNIKPFFGKPMLAYPIESALQSDLFDAVVVSTEDNEIAEVARSYGAHVPFMRPNELAQDDTATAPVILHAINWYEQQGFRVDMCSCIYPCTPFTSSHLLKQAFSTWQASGADYCLSVCEYPSAPQRALTQLPSGRLTSMYPEYRGTRTQDLDKTFFDAGQFYFMNPEVYKKGVPMHSEASLPIVLPRYLAHDIDTLEDWQLAELFYGLLSEKQMLNGL